MSWGKNWCWAQHRGQGTQKADKVWLLGLAKDELNNSWLSQERKGHEPRPFMVLFSLRKYLFISKGKQEVLLLLTCYSSNTKHHKSFLKAGHYLIFIYCIPFSFCMQDCSRSYKCSKYLVLKPKRGICVTKCLVSTKSTVLLWQKAIFMFY